jgi:hypothetical protein
MCTAALAAQFGDDRSHVNDLPDPLSDHLRRRRLCAEERAVHVEGEGLPPQLRGNLQERPSLRPARVVDQDIAPAERRYSSLDEHSGLDRISKIGAYRNGHAPALPDPLDQLLGTMLCLVVVYH